MIFSAKDILQLEKVRQQIKDRNSQPNIYESASESENHYIKWCCYEMKNAKTRSEVYRIKCIWCNHIDRSFDYIIDACIPKEFR